MAHIEKFKASQVNGLLEHNSRTDKTRPHNHRNEDIDPTRTKDNYELHSSEGTAQQRHKARLSQLHVMKRDDVIVLDSLVVTLPQDVKPEDERKFFQSVYEFACEDYGKENIVNATVHKDETTPHIHLGFIPVVDGSRRNGEPCKKVRHSALITRTYLDTMHTRLSEKVESDLGYRVSILNGATPNVSKTVAQLKAQKAEEQAKQAEQEAEELRRQVCTLSERVINLTEQAEQAQKRAEEATDRALTAEASLVNVLHSVPPLELEQPKPKASLPDQFGWEKRPEITDKGFRGKLQARKRDKWDKEREQAVQERDEAYEQHCAEVAARNTAARQEWEDKYLTPDNLRKATEIIAKRKRAVETDSKSIEAEQAKLAVERQQLEQERAQLKQQQQSYAQNVRNAAQRLINEANEETYGKAETSRMERLESFCDNIRRNGQTVLQVFEEREAELARQRAEAVELKLSDSYGYGKGR